MAGWLPWTEREAVAALLDDLAPLFETPGAYSLWRAGALASFIGGTMAFVGTTAGGWLLQGGDRLWRVIAAVGAFDVAAIAAVLPVGADLVVWDAELGPEWVAALADAGARGFTRRSYVQDLAAVAFREEGEEGAIAPWDGHPEIAGAIEVLVAANVGAVEGMFLTPPKPPTAAHCRAAFARVLDGAHGAFLPWASFVASDEAGPCGALLCVQGPEAHQGVLFDLAVAPRAQGRGLSRRLVAAMQKALLAAGYRENHFLTMATNAPVHALFRSEEIVEVEDTSGGYWSMST